MMQKKKVLEIEFHHGAVYQYFAVPERVFEELVSSAAKGIYYLNEIKKRYNYNSK